MQLFIFMFESLSVKSKECLKREIADAEKKGEKEIMTFNWTKILYRESSQYLPVSINKMTLPKISIND